MNFIDIIKKRRSVYNLGNTEIVKKTEIKTIIEELLSTVPTPYNIQSERVVLLFGEHHKKLWNIVLNALKPLVSPENFIKTEKNIEAFAAGYGTVLYFVDKNAVKELEEKLPAYKHNMHNWCVQANAMLQFAVWTALADKNVGASLQHYNPLIDEEVRKTFNLPDSWQLIAQMPFGNIISQLPNKSKLEVNNKLKVFM